MDIDVTIKLSEEELVDQERHSVSPYARWFNDKCAAWTKNPEHNKFYLLRQQMYANDRLKHNGYLFLNEVYDMLGLPKTKSGQVVGWLYDPNNPNRDCYVDFGLFVTRNQDFANGLENSVLLDFNVDGVILDQI